MSDNEPLPVAVPPDAASAKQLEPTPDDEVAMLGPSGYRPPDFAAAGVQFDRNNPLGIRGAARAARGADPSPKLRSFLAELGVAAVRSPAELVTASGKAVVSLAAGHENAQRMVEDSPWAQFLKDNEPTAPGGVANTIGGLPGMISQGLPGMAVSGFNRGEDRTDGNILAGFTGAAISTAAGAVPLGIANKATAGLGAKLAGTAAVGGVSNVIAAGTSEQALRLLGADPQDPNYLRAFLEGSVMGAAFTGGHALTARLGAKLSRVEVEAFDKAPQAPEGLGNIKLDKPVEPPVDTSAPAEAPTIPADGAPAQPKSAPGEAGAPADGALPAEPPSARPALRGTTPGEQFFNAIQDGAAAHPFGAAVEVKDQSFYNDPRTKLFLAPDGGAGVAVTPEGDLVSVFRHPGSESKIQPLLIEAAKVAKTLDGFDIGGKLPDLYGPLGFRPVARVAFNREFAPPGWNYDRMGTPDVVLMVKDTVGASEAPVVPGKDSGGYGSVREQIPLLEYDQATVLQKKARGAVDRENVYRGYSEVLGKDAADGMRMLADLGHKTESGITGVPEYELWSRKSLEVIGPDGKIHPDALMQVTALHQMFKEPAAVLPEDVQKLPGVQKNAKDPIKGMAQIDAVQARHPAPYNSEAAWNRFVSDVYRQPDVPVAPLNLISWVKDPAKASAILSGLNPEQVQGRRDGLANGQRFRDAYVAGQVTPSDTAKLALWGILSRRLTPYYHEAAALDLMQNPELDRLINDAIAGKAPDPSGVDDKGKPTYDLGGLIPKDTPGRPGTGNANDYARTFLTKLSQASKDGVPFLQTLHEIMGDQTLSGAQKRRRIMSELPDSHGLGVKVWSFLLLATGHQDVLVLDRVQARNLWGRPEFGDMNIYEGPDGTDGFAKILDDNQSLAVQEKMEEGVTKFVKKAYEGAGMSAEEATPGAWHWDSWNAESAQGANHGSLDYLLGSITGDQNLQASARSAETRNNSREFGASYRPTSSGGEIAYGVGDGPKYTFAPAAWSELVKWMGQNVVPPEWNDRGRVFKVGQFDTKTFPEMKAQPWYDLLPRTQRQLLEAEVAKRGQPVRAGADGSNRLQSSADGAGVRLNQSGPNGVRGTFRWLAEAGQGLTQLVKGNADPITGLHELVHYWEATVFQHRPDLIARFAAESGAQSGTRKFSEALAEAVQANVLHGKVPEGLAPAMAKFRSWARDLYAEFLASPNGKQISIPAHDLFRFAAGEAVPFGGIENLDGTAARISRTVNDLVSKGTPFDEATAQATVEHLNLAHISAPENVAALITAIEREVTSGTVNTKDGAVRSLEQTKMRALSILGDQAGLIDWAGANVDQIATLDSKLIALKSVRNALALKLGELSAERAADMHSGPGDALDIEATMRAVETVSELTSRIQRGAARTVSAGRIDTGAGSNVQDTVNAITSGLAELKQLGETLRATGANVPNSDLVSMLNNPKNGAAVNNALNGASTQPSYMPRLITFLKKQSQSKGSKALDMYLEFRGAALLSGAKTFDANFLGNVVNTMLKPWNQIMGGAVSFDPKTVKSGLGMYYQVAASALDFINLTGAPSSARMAGQAFMNNKPMIDATSDVRPGAIPVWLGGGIVRLPFRGLQGADELFKQINYRAAVRQKVIDQINTLPDAVLSKMTTEQRKAAVMGAVQQAIGPEGQAALTPEGDLKFPKEMQYAREAAYQQDPGAWTQSMLDFAEKIPALRIVTPFIRVPGNILGKTWDHTPGLNLLRDDYAKRFQSPDPTVRAEARGEMATGAAVLAASTALAIGGLTTGGGPIDPKRRQALIESGWQPYSFVIPQSDGSKKYISYMRMEPFGPLFGVPADAVNAWGYMSNEDGDRVADAMLVSVARNTTDKTYLRGLADVLKFLDPNQPSFVQRFTASHVPSALGTTNSAWDDSMRAPTSVLEAVKARIPFLSDQVSPKRDLYGAPVNPPAGWVPFFDTQDRGPLANTARTLSPIATNTSSSDESKLELARLNYPFARPSPGLGGLDLRTFRGAGGQTAYDRLLELTGEIRLTAAGIPTLLPDAMNKLIASSDYQKLPPPDGLNDAENPRVMRVKQVLSRYYEAAQIKMLKEFPEIQKMTKDALKTERTGNPYGSDLLEHLQKSNY